MGNQATHRIPAYERAIAFLTQRVNYENFQKIPYLELVGRLDRFRELLAEWKNPEKRFLTVHVAGTKGKGSTCTLLKSILRQAGYRIGLFSSPHLYSPLERFAVDGTPCDAEEFGELMLSLRDRLKNQEKTLRFTYFELTTLFAFEYFAQKQVDVAILEVGLGGRLDATNTCSPTVTVITNISFDHVEQLGPTLELIAAEKAGIIKPGIPLVAGPESDEAQRIIKTEAETVGSPSFFLGEDFCVAAEGKSKFRFVPSPSGEAPFREVGSLSLKLLGEHQRNNAALAIATTQLLKRHLKVPVPALRDGLVKAFLPVRTEQFRPFPGSPVFVVDGAHNQASVAALVRALKGLRPFHRKFLIFGTSFGKDVEGMFAELLPFFDHIVLTQYSLNPRYFPPQELLTILRSLDTAPKITVDDNACHALEECWRIAERNDLVCATGSMYLASELRKYFLDTIT